MSCNFFFRKSCRLWGNVKNMVERSRPQMKIWRMRIACWIHKATNIHSEYLIFVAFPLPQRYVIRTYIACLYKIKLYESYVNSEKFQQYLLHISACGLFLILFSRTGLWKLLIELRRTKCAVTEKERKNCHLAPYLSF